MAAEKQKEYSERYKIIAEYNEKAIMYNKGLFTDVEYMRFKKNGYFRAKDESHEEYFTRMEKEGKTLVIMPNPTD